MMATTDDKVGFSGALGLLGVKLDAERTPVEKLREELANAWREYRLASGELTLDTWRQLDGEARTALMEGEMLARFEQAAIAEQTGGHLIGHELDRELRRIGDRFRDLASRRQRAG